MTEPSSFILHPGDGDVLKFGPPISGELIINVDARRSGSAFAMGTQTLQPGGVLPTIRHLGCDQVFFIHKGQGRVSLEGRSLTVVPGTMIYVPRQTWHSLRNTGTGLLQMTWTAAPGGIEDFFREFAQLKDSSDAAAVGALAQRHGVEFRSETESASAAAPEGGRHRRHRGRRGGRGRRAPTPPPSAPQGQAPAAIVPVAPAARPPQAAATPVSQQQPGRRRRRHRGGRGRSGASAQPSQAPQSKTTATPAAHAPASKQAPAAKPQRTGQRSGRGRPHRGRVKEVYMDGRWVTVSGEGPVIAPGREHIRDKKSSGRDEDTPPGPLTVPL